MGKKKEIVMRKKILKFTKFVPYEFDHKKNEDEKEKESWIAQKKILRSDLDQSVSNFLVSKNFGLGFSRARQLCYRFGVNPVRKIKYIPPEPFRPMKDIFSRSSWLVNQRLRNFYMFKIQEEARLRTGSYFRRRDGLPVRGQRTRTNSRTSLRLRRNRNYNLGVIASTTFSDKSKSFSKKSFKNQEKKTKAKLSIKNKIRKK